MSINVDLRVIDLLCSRLCHELISPVGAINNGVELLSEEDPSFVDDAMALIRHSGQQAGRRLQFYRFAYGLGTASSVERNAAELVSQYFDGSKISCVFAREVMSMPGEWQKLACNITLLAAEALPRGGRIVLYQPPGNDHALEAIAAGEAAQLHDATLSALREEVDVMELSPRSIQAYYTGRIAQALGAQVSITRPAPNQLALAAVQLAS